MICPECGQESNGNFCSICGARLMTEPTPATPATPITPVTSATPAASERPASREADREPRKNSLRESRGSSRRKSRHKFRKEAAAGKDMQKTMRRRDTQINRLESEVDRLSRQQRIYAERGAAGRENGDEGSDMKELAVKGVTGITVLSSRLMQLGCGLLMAYMTWLLTAAFWSGRRELGGLSTIIGDRNYQLAVYAAAGGGILFFGILWTLWILSRKDGGGSVRLKKYDTGRGFIPFLLCLAIASLIPAAAGLIPPVDQITGIPWLSVDTHVWQSLAAGADAIIHTLADHRSTLLSCSALGLVFSIVRKILRV